MMSATVYCSLITCDVDETAIADGGCAAECGMYDESTVSGGIHVIHHCT